MHLQTLVLGEIEYSEDDVIAFGQGIPGFEEYGRFIIAGRSDEELFAYLQSVDNERLHFVVLNPFTVLPGYEFELSESDQAELQIDSEEGIEVWSILTLAEEMEQITVNLMAPIVINTRQRQGKQIVLHHSPYETRHRLADLLRANRQEGE